VDPRKAKRLEPRRLASPAVLGVLIGLISIIFLGSEGPDVVSYIGVTLMVVLTAPWLVAVLWRGRDRERPR
jgi:ABC-type Co2+ transport system permease subunit